MTTSTKAKKTDIAAKGLAKLEEAAAKAREEARKLEEKFRTQQAQRQQLDAELANLARQDRSQFDGSGLPTTGSDAAKLKAAREKLDQSQLSGVVAGAQDRARQAEDAVTRHTEAHADLLARTVYEGPGRAAVAKIQRGLAMAQEGAAEYGAVALRLTSITSAVNGLDGQDVQVDGRVQRLTGFAQEMEGLSPPRSLALTPLESEEVPRKIKMKGGGFAEAGHLRDEDIHPDQPQRVSA